MFALGTSSAQTSTVDGRNFASKILENESQYNCDLAAGHGVGQPAVDTPLPPNLKVLQKR